MSEPLTTQLVAELLPKLLTAFPSKISSQNPAHTAEVYRNGLRGIDGDAFRAAVDLAIQNDNFFPKVARLRELAQEWNRRNRATVTARIESAWNRCNVCGAEARTQIITRAAVDSLGLPVIGEDGKPVIEKVESHGLYMEHDPAAHRVMTMDAEGAA